MKAILLLLACLALCACTPPPDTEADKAAITAMHADWVSTIEQLNIEGELAHWMDDGILMQPNTPPVVGKAQMRERLQFFNEVSVSNVNVTIDELEVAGDWAYIRQTFKSTWAARDGSEAEDEDGKEIMILKRQPDNTWRIARYIWNTNLPSH